MPDDIMSLALRVMEQAIADNDADLRQMMDEMRKRREALDRLRKALAELTRIREASASGESDFFKSISDFLAGSLQSVGDATGLMQQRLQMLMDRRSKAMEMLSNILKKQSDTASCIIKNLK